MRENVQEQYRGASETTYVKKTALCDSRMFHNFDSVSRVFVHLSNNCHLKVDRCDEQSLMILDASTVFLGLINVT